MFRGFPNRASCERCVMLLDRDGEDAKKIDGVVLLDGCLAAGVGHG